jgi:hypothetical protein
VVVVVLGRHAFGWRALGAWGGHASKATSAASAGGS